ncbi:MAG: hypothetical protein COB14_05360 [Alphaproteobacteria bacterium]|nr:MAG: hypothetical protein COB14_05360 [Alphaproteobacteria bacterium]
MSNDENNNFSALHQQFLAHIDPTTSRLPTPIVKATVEFSETLRKALLKSQTFPIDMIEAKDAFKTALDQRDNLLQNEQVKNDPKLMEYLNEVIVVTGKGTENSLQATWNKHAVSYDETPNTIAIPDMPEGFPKIHAQFWEYMERTQETLQTNIQNEMEEFSALLGASIAGASTGQIDEAHQRFERCKDIQKTLLENPKITQNKELTHYISNVMADINNDTAASLQATTKWHSDAASLMQKNNDEPLFDTVKAIDENEESAPLFTDEEWEEFSNPAPKDNILDFPSN